jgi:hypothetical protein
MVNNTKLRAVTSARERKPTEISHQSSDMSS